MLARTSTRQLREIPALGWRCVSAIGSAWAVATRLDAGKPRAKSSNVLVLAMVHLDGDVADRRSEVLYRGAVVLYSQWLAAHDRDDAPPTIWPHVPEVEVRDPCVTNRFQASLDRVRQFCGRHHVEK